MNKITKILLSALVFLLTLSNAQAKQLKPGDKLEHYGGEIVVPSGRYGFVEEITVPPTGVKAHTPNPDCSSGSIDYPSLVEFVRTMGSSNSISGISTMLSNAKLFDSYENIVGTSIASTTCGLVGCKHSTNVASCVPIIVVLPKGAKTKSYAIMALNPSGTWLKCGHGDDTQCGIAWMSFPGNYNKDTIDGREVITVTFKHWKHDEYRHARLVVIYEMPSGEEPIELL